MFTPLTIFFGFIALGLLIFVHETGHFLVAKIFGVRVITYSFGFGHRLFGIRYKGTDYRVSAIPFGGYVRMWGADPFEVEEHEAELAALESVSDGEPYREPQFGEWALQDVAVWKRLLIYAAGPAANLVVPFFVFVVLFMAGEPQLASVVGTVVGDTPAAEAGIVPGDRVVEVFGQPVTTWEEMAGQWELAAEAGGPVELVVERGEQRLSFSLSAPSEGVTTGSAYDYGLRLDVPSANVGVLHSDSPAGRAGLQTGDLLITVAGQEVETWPQAARLLSAAGDQVQLTWLRDDASHEATLVADAAWIPPAVRPLLDDVPVDRWGLQTATLFVGGFSDDSAAQAAGVAEGAFLLAIDGKRVESWYEVLRGVAVTMVEDGEERVATEVAITVLQGDAAMELSMLPSVQRVTDARGRFYWRPLIGVASLGGWADSPKVRVFYPFHQAVARAGRDSVLLIRYTLEQLAMLVTGEASMKDSLGGPVEIVRQTTKAAKSGWMSFSRLLGMISISVGIFNLLPVPVLDGGHLLFYSLEAIRGRPVSPLFRERAQIVGVMLLIALMIFVTYNDVLTRIFGVGG